MRGYVTQMCDFIGLCFVANISVCASADDNLTLQDD